MRLKDVERCLYNYMILRKANVRFTARVSRNNVR